MNAGVRWIHGDEKLQRALEDLLHAEDSASAGLDWEHEHSGRRRWARVRLASGERLFLKQTFGASHRHATREQVKNALGFAAAEREARALRRLRSDAVPVPELRALGVLSNGDRLLATRELSGRSLLADLAACEGDRFRLLAQVGALIRRFHATGMVHRDLHGGNLLVTADGPVLLDLAAARRSRRAAARTQDVAFLDHSLCERLSVPDRVRLAAAALGLRRPFDADARRSLREVAAASQRRARAHAASRTRRALAPGRRFAALQHGGATGLRQRDVDPDALAGVLAAGTSTRVGGVWSELKSDRRARVTTGASEIGPLVLKQYRARGFARRIADRFRGSPARRAWRGAHGLAARGIATATPIAFLEHRRFGLPLDSLALFRAVPPGAPADACPSSLAQPDEVVDALLALVLRLHQRGAIHGDLKASHVLLQRDGTALTARLIDLEGVKFRRRMSDAERIHALAQLNASLPDDVPDALRCRAFARYAAALPFARGSQAALASLVRTSLARDHRWTGAQCPQARR